jgi:enoyl-CoA hydratase / 3-hydroxyacyl-CoA dehydrogenase
MRKENFYNPALIKPTRGLPQSVAIIGAGTIGPDIGYYLKSDMPDLKLVLIDINEKALEKALARIEKYTGKGISMGKITPEVAEKIKKNIVTSTDYEALADCDWVLEAATENLKLKQEIFSRVEALVRPDALITSNTSSLPAKRIFSHLKHPERTTVTHFFAPAFKNPVVEIIEWDKADPAVIDYLRWFFYATGKTPMVTEDVVCFMLDRIFDNWCNEAALLVGDVTAAEIDSVAAEFVHAGPFFVLNFANGNAIIPEVNTIQMEEGEHYRPADIFDSVAVWNTVPMGKRVDMSSEKAQFIRDRLLGVLFSQTVDILDRSIGDASDLDLGCRTALGFKKGPLELMADMGVQEVTRILAKFTDFKAGMPMPKKPIAEYFNYYRYLLVSEMEGAIVITIRRPEALNAMHDGITDEILRAIKTHENDPKISGFVITGYGTKAFCAGADIGKFPTMLGDKQQCVEYARVCSRLLVHLDQCKKPVVAALNGLVLGGGLELAIRCHGIVAVEKAWMQLPEITLGIVPGIGAMVVPYRRWPKASTTFHEMLLTAKKLKAKEAFEIGMVDELVTDHADLIPAAIAAVKRMKNVVAHILEKPVAITDIVSGPTKSVTGQVMSQKVVEIVANAVKAAAAAPSLAEALEVGYDAFGESALTAAAKEGIGAFMERRRADYETTG